MKAYITHSSKIPVCVLCAKQLFIEKKKRLRDERRRLKFQVFEGIHTPTGTLRGILLIYIT